MLNTVPRTWVAGEVVSASQMNAEIRDAIAGVEAAWVPYVPTIQGVSVQPGTLLARWHRIGKTIDLTVAFTLAAQPSGSVVVSTPVAGSAAGGLGQAAARGSASGVRQGVAYYTGVVLLSSPTELVIVNSGGNLWNGTNPASWQNGDVWSLNARYEAA